MLTDTLSVLESLSVIYEDLDIDNVEEKFIELINEAFSFDRTALFFVKHKKQVLRGKLSKGFAAEAISGLEIPLSDEYILTTPMITGAPYWHEAGRNDSFTRELELENFVLIPVVNKKRVACWEEKNCANTDCPAYGKKWLRCWLISGTKCCEGAVSREEKSAICAVCPIFLDQNLESMEGVILADNSISREPIRREEVLTLSIIAQTVGRAISNSKLYTKTLNESIRDPLTDLHNRRFFDERLLDEIDRAKRYNDSLSLILCDIDHFKRVNDTFGHPTGDKVLNWTAGILKEKHRKSDVIARYGGEEFAILLINTHKELAVEIAEKLRRSIADDVFSLETEDIRLTMSFGVAGLGEDAASFTELIDKADKALYSAKKQGRNKVCPYTA